MHEMWLWDMQWCTGFVGDACEMWLWDMQWCTGYVGHRHGACFGKASDVGVSWWLWHIFSHLKKKKIEYKKGIFSGLGCIYSSYSTISWCFIKLFVCQVLACQETDPKTGEKFCSNRAITVARTKRLGKCCTETGCAFNPVLCRHSSTCSCTDAGD